MRTCTDCGLTKPLEVFRAFNGAADYFHRCCRECWELRAQKRSRPAELTCTECGQTKPTSGFVRIKRLRASYYGTCRVRRNRRAHERYYSNPEICAAEIARWLKNNRLRKLRSRAEAMAAVDS
jgi:hypothetical protein